MTTLFLATTGGHLDQLDDLSRRVRDRDDAVWVTHENAQSHSLLRGRDVEFVPYVGVRAVGDVLQCVPTAHRLLRERTITRAVSTGSGIALGYLPYLAARGVECHYIESAARVSAPSLTGRVLQWVPRVRRYTQSARWADPRWTYSGSVFDSYRPESRQRASGDALRVVVTVGTAREFPFVRLLNRLVPLLAADGPLARTTGRAVHVLWQTGCTPTAGWDIAATPFLGAHDLAKALAGADIAICHAGTGSALGALNAGLLPVLATRVARFGEAGDDHQIELAEELARRRLALRRDPGEITADDLLAVAGQAAVRCSDPPAFELRS